MQDPEIRTKITNMPKGKGKGEWQKWLLNPSIQLILLFIKFKLILLIICQRKILILYDRITGWWGSISISNNEKLFIPNTITKVATSSQRNTVGVGKSDKHKINAFGIFEFPILTSKGVTLSIFWYTEHILQLLMCKCTCNL